MIIYDINWEAKTAGPSPDGTRTELFLFGCSKAKNGNPCKGCFNHELWDSSIATKTHKPKDIADNINKFAPNKYITIGGGEPTDQLEELIELCKYLKEYDFHIMVYTYKELKNIFSSYDYRIMSNGKSVMSGSTMHKERLNFENLLKYIDMLVDGPFIKEECLYTPEKLDGLFNSVGSGNQIIWDIESFNHSFAINLKGFYLKDLKGITLNINNTLHYNKKNDAEEQIVKIR